MICKNCNTAFDEEMFCPKCGTKCFADEKGKELKKDAEIIKVDDCEKGHYILEKYESIEEDEELISKKKGAGNNGLMIFGGIVSGILWIVIFKVFFEIYRAKEKDFNGWYNLYDTYGSISVISKIIFYGVIIGVGVFTIIGIFAALKRNKKCDFLSILGCVIIAITFFVMNKYVDATENHFMDTANIYLKYVANAVYVVNIDNTIYVYLVFNVLAVKFKQIAGKY